MEGRGDQTVMNNEHEEPNAELQRKTNAEHPTPNIQRRISEK